MAGSILMALWLFLKLSTQRSDMCAPRKDGEPWAAYAFRYSVELVEAHAGGVLAVLGLALLLWYSEKADMQQERLVNIIKENQEFMAKQTAAIQELTIFIKKGK